MKKVIVLILFLFSANAQAGTNIQQLFQLVDYIGVDYREAVRDGQIVNAGEYEEMQDFSLAILDQVRRLPESVTRRELVTRAEKLTDLVANKTEPDVVSTLSSSMRTTLIENYNIPVIPQRSPNLKQAQLLYTEQCAGCHGNDGLGDGLLSVGLEPSPTNFTDKERYRERSLFGLYNTITQGVAGTAMQGYGELSESQRWNLAFYVGSLATTVEDVALGETLFNMPGENTPLADLQSLTTTTPAEAQTSYGNDGTAVMAYLRHQPQGLFKQGAGDSLAFARKKLDESLVAYNTKDYKLAYELAVQAYLEGFELIENGLDAVDSELRVEIEKSMTAYRNLIRDRTPDDIIALETMHIQALLAAAEEKLDRTHLSGKAAFASALIILLREGLEALLVVAALAAFLVKTGRRDGLPWLYTGVIGALALGGLTWLASTTIIDISGMQRELTEGIAALLAAGVLFYVGFWLHNKTSAMQWKKFINGSVEKALSKGTLWGLTGLSFIAVFREVLETVLFYQALWIQTEETSQSMILYGLVAASAILVVLAWLIMRYSARLPLRQFFAVTSIFMFVMAIVFAGKGIAALQEAGKLSLDPVTFPTIDLLGIYPNVQGLLVQLLLIIVAVFMWVKANSIGQPSTH